MPLEKHCAQPGCKGYPMFGFGSASNGLMRWACKEHRCQIWIGARVASAESGRGSPPRETAPRPLSTSFSQGRLF